MNFYSPRIENFGRHAVMLRARPGESLGLDLIRAHAPTVFAEEAHSSRSARFATIPTAVILQGMIDEGFLPVEVKVGGSSDAEKRAFTKHLIRFRRAGDSAKLVKVGDVVPEVILKNANDGTSQYSLMAGLFRLACLNGLVVADSMIGSIKVPHRGDAMGKVIEGSYSIIEDSSRVLDKVHVWKGIELAPAEQRAFARAALPLRFDDEVPVGLEVEQALNVRRSSDVGGNLWITYNRVQENLMKGGMSWAERRESGNRIQIVSRTSRPVRSVDGDVKLNRALWTLAEEMEAIKKAA
jgi:hypothetical protein